MKGIQSIDGIEEYYFGTQWYVLTREFVKFSLYSSMARDLLIAMTDINMFAPDETFFQTLLLNSDFRNTSVSYPSNGFFLIVL